MKMELWSIYKSKNLLHENASFNSPIGYKSLKLPACQGQVMGFLD